MKQDKTSNHKKMKQYTQGIKTDVMSQHKDELWKEWGRNALKPCINPPQGAPATHPEPSVSPRSEPLPVLCALGRSFCPRGILR